jgi:protein CLEC16A
VFIENNIIASLFGLLNQHATHKDVVMKIISTMASFITNMSKAIHVNYILSHATLNSFIEYEYDFSDEEIVDYYVNFLKSLTLRMDRVNIKLYFNQVP